MTDAATLALPARMATNRCKKATARELPGGRDMTATPAEPTGKPGPRLPADGKQDDRPRAATRAKHTITGWDVRAALAHLSVEHRQVIVEIYYNSRSVYETADVLQIPVATVTSRAYAGVRQLVRGLAAPAATPCRRQPADPAQPSLRAWQRLADHGLQRSGQAAAGMCSE